jgi:molybdopterin synthase catalytic subunit
MSLLRNIVEISADPLPSLDDITNLVQDDGAGAITTFSGTTRNVFEGNLFNDIYIPWFLLTCLNRQDGH